MEAHRDSFFGFSARSGNSYAGMSDFTAMKTPPPPQPNRSFPVKLEGKHEYVRSKTHKTRHVVYHSEGSFEK